MPQRSIQPSENGNGRLGPQADSGRSIIKIALMVGSVAMVPTLIACGAASDRQGRLGIFMVGAVLAGFWAFAMFPLIEFGRPLAITVAIAVELMLLSLMYGPQAALFAELFPVEVRYSGASLEYQVGSVFSGGSRQSSPPRCSRGLARAPLLRCICS